MDNHLNNPNNYTANVMNQNNSTSSTYSPQQGITSSVAPQTLPPLQPQNTAMQSLYTNTHTPRTPGTPGTPGTPAQGSGYATPSSLPPTTRAPYQMMSGSQYPTHQQAYSSSMMPQTTQAVSHPQPIAPAPASARGTSGAVPPALRPLAQGMPGNPGMSYAQSALGQPQMMGVEADQPTHVVGSQGRRGILPSAPGRPAAAPAGTAAAKSTVPVKDADGKYPCPHCTKTYLHAKHLKRHLLRHTGDRPYMCVLCRDTFSRSDILKRHFQKCSIRRGNPTGASHLSHPQAHVKKSQQAAQKAALENGDLSQMNGLGLPGDGMVHQYGGIPVSDDPNRSSRPVGMGGSAYASDIPTTVNANVGGQMAPYGVPQNQNGMPMFTGSNSNQQSNVDWAQMFQAGAQNTYVNAFPPNVGQTQTAIKDPSHIDSPDAGAADRSLFFVNPNQQYHVGDPYQQLSMRILNFLSPSSVTTNLGYYFSGDNVKDFLTQYTHFNVHMPMLHIPTFRIMEAYTGLVAAMCCVGACYSPRIGQEQVREAMECVKTSLERDSKVFRSVMPEQQDLRPDTPFDTKKNDIEEIQSLMLMQILFLWHGSPTHREAARNSFPMAASFARRNALLTPASDLSLFSPLHQPSFSPQGFDIAQFDWHSWAEQEKRLRLMYIMFTCDAALGLYFNATQQFDGSEIHLPLPADDAAWDARSPGECAEALGLHGETAARGRNPYGTRRSHQPELGYCLRALHSRQFDVRPGATNLYGKFIIIHALMTQLRRLMVDGQTPMSSGGIPLSQNDWLIRTANGGTSGRGTPAPGSQPATYTISDVLNALEKFKVVWDNDMMTQFPTHVQGNPRRAGFGRDAIPFYWVAKYLAKNTAPGDLSISGEQRVRYILALLKSVNAWVESDAATRGEEMGSVGTIDKDYGVADVTFDMARLFTPIPGLGQ
ncbi:hypothetical protein MKZ38_003247 [Zalerion maritima]|uniref:C2H2-type domain-containing protein n=1 Tax=Zalerion maritima TaxID=339359 RepID=A0AAD5RZ21_9PEZI|nr:hypothetical protein MKZ38_003247 [Zalerion maritima]